LSAIEHLHDFSADDKKALLSGFYKEANSHDLVDKRSGFTDTDQQQQQQSFQDTAVLVENYQHKIAEYQYGRLGNTEMDPLSRKGEPSKEVYRANSQIVKQDQSPFFDTDLRQANFVSRDRMLSPLELPTSQDHQILESVLD